MDKSERYLKEIAKSLASIEKSNVDILKELKRLNKKSQYNSTGAEKI